MTTPTDAGTEIDTETDIDIEAVGRQRFGFAELRPGQEEAVRAVLAGRDTLAVMPTGSGKSAIYQIAGVLLDGPTVVVSPLIALQRDQVESIGGRELGGATEVNSTMSTGARSSALDRVSTGDVEFVVLAPEQLANPETVESLVDAGPSLFVVDEAHCISSWGFDFRPDYLRLGGVVEALGHPTVLALTATAAPPVRRQIAEHLGMVDPVTVVRGFARPNLRLEVDVHGDGTARGDALGQRVAATDGTGIVYVATRRQAEELAHQLGRPDRPALAYHGGLAKGRRDEVHERFLAGDPCVVVATIAFGMGVDAPHVRFVFHAEPPESVDAYYQEVGRAGRDGAPAVGVLFHRLDDFGGRRFFGGTGAIPVDLLERLATAVHQACDPVPLALLADLTGLSESRLLVALSRLEAVGALEVEADGSVHQPEGAPPPEEAARQAAEGHEAFRTAERSRLEMMRRFAEQPVCRWQYVLEYFGEPGAGACGRCDQCDHGHADGRHRGRGDGVREEEGRPAAVESFGERTRVHHQKWGEGEVIAWEGDVITVLFDEGGYRTLSADVVLARGLLEPLTGEDEPVS